MMRGRVIAITYSPGGLPIGAEAIHIRLALLVKAPRPIAVAALIVADETYMALGK